MKILGIVPDLEPDLILSRVRRDPFGSFNPELNPSDGDGRLPDEYEAIIMTRKIAYSIIGPIIIISGILGNILTLLILRNPIFKGVMFNFFLALAIFDLLSLIFSISGLLHMLNPLTSSYLISVWYSYCETLSINTTMGTSLLLIVCISFYRFMSVCRPHNFKTIHTDRFCRIGIIGSFLVSLIVWLPSSFLKFPSNASECDTFYYKGMLKNSTVWIACLRLDFAQYEWYNAYAWIREIIISFVPIVLVIVLNGFLVKYFIKKHKIHSISQFSKPHHDLTNASSRQVGDKNLKDLLKAIIISFSLTILPGGIFNAYYSEILDTTFRFELFRAFANLLELLNHALNFYLYILLCKPIRSVLPSLFISFKKTVVKKLDVPKGFQTISRAVGPLTTTKEEGVGRSEHLLVVRGGCKRSSGQSQESSITSVTSQLERPAHENEAKPEDNAQTEGKTCVKEDIVMKSSPNPEIRVH